MILFIYIIGFFVLLSVPDGIPVGPHGRQAGSWEDTSFFPSLLPCTLCLGWSLAICWAWVIFWWYDTDLRRSRMGWCWVWLSCLPGQCSFVCDVCTTTLHHLLSTFLSHFCTALWGVFATPYKSATSNNDSIHDQSLDLHASHRWKSPSDVHPAHGWAEEHHTPCYTNQSHRGLAWVVWGWRW